MKQPGRPFVGISNREKLEKICASLMNSGERFKELILLNDDELEKLSSELNQLTSYQNKRENLEMLIEGKLNV